MEGICGVLSSSNAASWAQAIGTVLAVGIAVWLYYRGRADQRRDMQGRRAVVVAMARPALQAAHAMVQVSILLFDEVKGKADATPTVWGMTAEACPVPELSRLTELQQLFGQFGSDGDAQISVFIEACRLVETRRTRLIKTVKFSSVSSIYEPEGDIEAYGKALRFCDEQAAAALAALDEVKA